MGIPSFVFLLSVYFAFTSINVISHMVSGFRLQASIVCASRQPVRSSVNGRAARLTDRSIGRSINQSINMSAENGSAGMALLAELVEQWNRVLDVKIDNVPAAFRASINQICGICQVGPLANQCVCVNRRMHAFIHPSIHPSTHPSFRPLSPCSGAGHLHPPLIPLVLPEKAENPLRPRPFLG